MYTLLNKIQGDIKEIKNYLAFRKLEVIPSQVVNTSRIQLILLMGGLTYLVYPLIALLVWFILNIIDRAALKQSVIPAISIILVGLSYIMIIQNFMSIKWNQFKFNFTNIFLILIAFSCLLIYQGLVIFGYDEDPKFLPYSSFFMIFNFIIITIFVFFDAYSESKDILYIIEKNFPKTGVTIDRKRDKILSEEIQGQKSDPLWKCNFEDLTDFITISQVSFETFQSIFGANFLQQFNKKGDFYKRILKYSLLFLSLTILAVYAFILYRFDNDNKTGIIVAIAVTFLDIWTYFLVLGEVIEQPMFIITFLLLNRVLIIGPGEWYWVYGIMILYLIYSIFFNYEIARKRFPSDEDIIQRKRTIQEIMKADKQQKIELFKKKIFQPELLFLIINLVYIGLLFAVQFGEWKGKRIWPFIVNRGYSYQKVLGTGYLALLTGGIAISIFLLIVYARIAIRKIKKTEQTSDYQEIFAKSFEKVPRCKPFYRFCSSMVVFSFLIFLFSIGWMIISWWLMRDQSVFVWGICLPIMVLSYIRGLIYLSLNDFEFFQDVEKLNISIDNHNKKIKQAEVKRAEILKKLTDGTLFLQVQNQASTIEPKLQGELNKMQTLSLVDQQQNNKLIGLIKKEEEIKRAEDEEKLRRINADEALRKQEEEEKIKMRKQISLEKEQIKQNLELKKDEKSNKVLAKNSRNPQIFKGVTQEELVLPQTIQSRNRIIQSLQPDQFQVYNFQGEVRTGESIQNTIPRKNHEIYEGGQPFIPSNSDLKIESSDTQFIQKKQDEDQQLLLEIDKIYLNLDEVEMEHDGYKQISVSRLKRVTNWRLLHDNKWHKAFLAGNLRPNDYAFISSMTLAFVAWACLLGGLLGTTSGALGAVIVVPIAYFGVSYVIAASVLYQSRGFTWKELILWIIIKAIYFGLSLAYFFIKFEIQKFKFTLNERPPEQMDATYFLFFYVICVPTAIHFIVCVLRIRERGFEGFLENFKYFVGIIILGLLLLVISCFLFVSAVQGAILIASLILVMFIIAQIFMYIQNGYAMTPFWQYFNGIVAFIMVFAPFIASFCTSSITLYQGISMSAAINVGILWIYAGAHFLQDFQELNRRPIYFSQSLYPIYKFNEKTKDVEKHYMPISSWIIGLVILMMWSLLTNTQVKPRWFGAFLTIVIEAIMILTLVLAKTLSITTINDSCDFMDEKICKSAWLYTKECYQKQQAALTPSHLVTYRRLWKQKYFVEQFRRCLQERELIQFPKFINEELKNEVAVPADIKDLKLFYKSKIEKFEESDKMNYEDIEEINNLGILLQNRLDETFIEELKQIIRFIMVASSASKAEKEIEKKDFFRFLNEKMDILLSLGIRILIPKTGSIDSQYLSVISQIEDLDDEHLDAFRVVEKFTQNEAQIRKENSNAANDAEKKRQEERDKLQDLQNKKRQEELRLFNEKLLKEKEERDKIQSEINKKKQEELRLLMDQMAQQQQEGLSKVQSEINKKVQEALHKQMVQLIKEEEVDEQKDTMIKVVNKKLLEKVQGDLAKKKQEELQLLIEQVAQQQKEGQTQIQAELNKKIQEELHSQMQQLSKQYKIVEKNPSKIIDDNMMANLKQLVAKQMFALISFDVILSCQSSQLNNNNIAFRQNFLDKAKDYALQIFIIKSTEGQEYGFIVPDSKQKTEKNQEQEEDMKKQNLFAFQFKDGDLQVYNQWIHPQMVQIWSNNDEFLSICMGLKQIMITKNLKVSKKIGKSWSGTDFYNDLDLLKKEFKTIPQIQKIDIYTDNDIIYGYEIIYKSSNLDEQSNKKTTSNNGFKIGPHKGSDVRDGIQCISFELQEGEFIAGLSVWNGDFIQRLEFQTNFTRTFEAGKPKNQIDDSFTFFSVVGKIIAFKAGLGYYLYNLEVYFIEDIQFKACSTEIFGIKKQTDPDDELIDIDADLDKMPDCLLKYKIIVKRAQERNEKFVDKTFSGDQALGQGLVESNKEQKNQKWIRVSERKIENENSYTLFKDGASYNDVKQGGLGTCYFLSALAVLDNQQAQNLFVQLISEDEFLKCGAFCVKFQLGGEETFIIIDDFFFYLDYSYESFAFCQANDGELWPMIVEKTYAKLYGSYEKIEGGHMQSALSELIPGFPMSIHHCDKPSNLLWNDLLKYHKLGYPLGTASPSHPEGDRAKSDTGIVQGHAYSILKLIEADNNKLICIRNPWGSSEWTGDWSDESEKWNKRFKNLVGFEGIKDDGIFWMDFNDYFKEFEICYICIELSQEQGWNQLKVNDKWVNSKEQSMKKNKRTKNDQIQYALKINKPGIAYLIFRLHNAVNNMQTDVFGSCVVFANKGKVIEPNKQCQQIGAIGPSNYNQVELELNFPANQSYPYTYTIIASLDQANESIKEPSFSIKVFTQDSDAIISKLN